MLQGFDAPTLEALVEIMFLAAHADDEFSDVERQHFIKSVETLTDRRLVGADLDTLLARIEGEWKTSGREERLKAVKARLPNPKTREIALSLAIDLMAADGIIRTSEREMILEAAEALDIDGDRAADLVQRATR